MQSKIDIKAVLGSQKSDMAVINVHSENGGGIFQFLKNSAYNHCRILDLVDGLDSAEDLKKVSLLGAMSLLNHAGLYTEKLRAKGAVTTLEEFVTVCNNVIAQSPEDRHTIRVLRDALELFVKQWKTGLLSQSDVDLNSTLDTNAIEILSKEWYSNLTRTDVELVEILHKRIARYVEDETRDYLSLYDRADRKEDQKSAYETQVKEKVLANYRGAKADAADLNHHIKNLRDLEVLSMYRADHLSPELSKRLDAEVRERIMFAARLSSADFKRDNSELSERLDLEQANKHVGVLVLDNRPFVEEAINDLLKTWKRTELPAQLNAQLVSYVMPLIKDLGLSAEVESTIINKCVDSVLARPASLKDSARVQYTDTVKAMIKVAVDLLVSRNDNEAGKAQMKEFCREVLDHWKVTSTPESLKKLFNTDISDLIRSLSALVDRNPGFFNHSTSVSAPVTTTPVVAANEAEKAGPSNKK